MSTYRRTSTMNGSSLNQSQKVKTFCKVCYDTGKTAEMYNSHFVRENRDPTSRILCPTLLALECRYCFVRGHTVSKCPKLRLTSSFEVSNCVNLCNAPKKEKSLCNNDDRSTCSNGFSLLYSSDDENDDDHDALTVNVTECSSVFPCLNTQMNSVNEVSTKTYAAALMAVLRNSALKMPNGNVAFNSFVADDESALPMRKGVKQNKMNIVVDTRDDDSCVSSVSGASVIGNEFVNVAVDLRKVFASQGKRLGKYSVPGSWAQDSDSDDE